MRANGDPAATAIPPLRRGAKFVNVERTLCEQVYVCVQ